MFAREFLCRGTRFVSIYCLHGHLLKVEGH